MRSRLSLLALMCAACLALAAPTAALAQLSGGGDGQLGAPEPTEGVPPAEDPTDDGWEAWQTIAVTLAGIALIAGIGFAIVGDARRAAPITEDELRHRNALLEDEQSERMHHKGGKARARKKQKIARESRKRNRQRAR